MKNQELISMQKTNQLTLPLGFHILNPKVIHMENQQVTTTSVRIPYILKDISSSI